MVVAGCMSAVTAWLLVQRPAMPALLLGFAGVAVAPAATVGSVLFLIEEETSPGGHPETVAGPLVLLGTSLYHVTIFGFRAVILLLIAAAAMAVFRLGSGFVDKQVLAIGLGLTSWTVVLALSQGYPLSGSVTAATPWICLTCGMVLGTYTKALRSRSDWLLRGLLVVLAVKAFIGLLSYVRGQTLNDPGGTFKIVYYDSLTSYLAMALGLACLMSYPRKSIRIFAATSAALIILLSMRRNVLAATTWALAIVPLLTRSVALYIRVALTALLLLVLAYAAFPESVTLFSSGALRAASAVTGRGQDTSATGHFNDIHEGLRLVLKSPIDGLGVYARATPPLVVTRSNNLYIHNDLLQTWARFGLPAALLWVTLLYKGLRYAVRILRSGFSTVHPLILCAAIYWIALPIPLMFFADLSSLIRWAFFSGLFIGLASPSKATGTRSRSQPFPRSVGAEPSNARHRLGTSASTGGAMSTS
jgi:O-antigen ligase